MFFSITFSPIEMYSINKTLDGSIHVAIIEAIHTIFTEKFGQFRAGLMRGVTFFGLVASTDTHNIAAINAINGHFSGVHVEARYGDLRKAKEILFTNILREKHSIDRHHKENTYGGRWGLTNDALSVKITEAITECIRKKYISQDEIDRITSQITPPELAPSSSP